MAVTFILITAPFKSAIYRSYTSQKPLNFRRFREWETAGAYTHSLQHVIHGDGRQNEAAFVCASGM